MPQPHLPTGNPEDNLIPLSFDRDRTVRNLERPRPWNAGETGDQSETLRFQNVTDSKTVKPIADWREFANAQAIWDSLPIARAGRYDFVSLLGIGGMGRVFKVRDRLLNREVALKSLQHLDPETGHRFLREAKAMAQVKHPNICTLYEAGEIGGHPFIVMEFIDGETLDRFSRPMTIERKVLLALEIAEALQAIHRLGLIHRDIKPGNILVRTEPDGSLKPFLTDFGLVRVENQSETLTSAGTIMGTPSFMSPEQALGDPLDRRTDVFSFGATLYAYLAGQPPFTGRTPTETIRKVIDEEPQSLRARCPSIPEDLDTIVMTCLEKDLTRRYQSARAVADDLRRFLDGERISARPLGFTYRLKRAFRRHRTLSIVGGVSICTVVFLLGMWVHALRVAERETRTAQQLEAEINQLEGGLRDSNLLPPHDSGEMRRRIRSWMQSKQNDATQSGSTGAGTYAIGRGHLALGEFSEARKSLEAAWNQGYRKPEVAYALGQTFSALAEWKAVEEETVSTAPTGETADSLRAEAVKWLESSGNGAVPYPEYREALIAYNQRRYQDAERLAQSAFAKAPWLYEAEQLVGNSEIALGRLGFQAGKVPSALDAFRNAGTAFRIALDAGESDSVVYEADALRWLEIARAQKRLGGDDSEALDMVRADCRQAAAINPESPRTGEIETWLRELGAS